MPARKISGIEQIKPPLRVKYKDIFDAKEFYTFLHEWCLQYGWNAEDGSERIETFFGEKIDRNGSKEIWIQWRTQKKAEGADITYYIDFNYHFLGLSTIEVVKEGIKMKVNKGELELYILPYLSKDYESKFNKDSLLKHVISFFNKRIYREAYEQRKKELYQETYALQNAIKQWFKLKRYMPYEEHRNWYPSYAWPSHLKE